MDIQASVQCRQCRKDIKTKAYRCIPCDNPLASSCHKLHKVYNAANELVPYIVEKYTAKSVNSIESGATGQESSRKDRKMLESRERKELEGNQTVNKLDAKIDFVYKLIKEIKNEMVGKEIIRGIIIEIIDEEMDRIRRELQHWRMEELEQRLSAAVAKEIQNVISGILTLSRSRQRSCESRNSQSYSGAVKNKQESVIIIKP